MKKSVSSGKKKVKSKSSSSAAAASGASSALSADVVAQLSDTHKRFALRAGDDCPTTHITVFSDRAEVVREVRFERARRDTLNFVLIFFRSPLERRAFSCVSTFLLPFITPPPTPCSRSPAHPSLLAPRSPLLPLAAIAHTSPHRCLSMRPKSMPQASTTL